MTDTRGYRGSLRGVVTAGAAPHGYTLALWTGGAVTTSARGAPDVADALALLTGATLAFVTVGAVAHGGPGRPLTQAAPRPTRVWAAFHLFTIGLGTALCGVLAHVLSGPLLWGLVGAVATTVYLCGAAAQFWWAGTGPGHVAGPSTRPVRGRTTALMLDAGTETTPEDDTEDDGASAGENADTSGRSPSRRP
ncbi:hypothetical protein [Streptomyces sp. NPDC093970]|uniref:hypothetical protein n=1 Tax=Streptomyces sp. NPDC093970 TaxID=3155076 RepID=UPI00342BB8D7